MCGGGALAGVWVQYQVLEGVSCSECFLLIHRVCVGGSVRFPLECVWVWGGVAGTYLIHWWEGHQVHQVRLVTVKKTAAMVIVLKQKEIVSRPDSSL